MIAIQRHPRVSSLPSFQRVITHRHHLPTMKRQLLVDNCPSTYTGFEMILEDLGLSGRPKAQAMTLLDKAVTMLQDMVVNGRFFDSETGQLFKHNFPFSHDSFPTSLGDLKYRSLSPYDSFSRVAFDTYTNAASLDLNDTKPKMALTYYYPDRVYGERVREIISVDHLDGVWGLSIGNGTSAYESDQTYYVYPIFPPDYKLFSPGVTSEGKNHTIRTIF